MSGFGRKGLAAGQTAPQQARSFGGSASRATPRSASTRGAAQPEGLNVYSSTEEAEEVRRKREAFLNEERSRPAGSYGEADANYPDYAEARHRSERSVAMAYICWFFLGQISMHRFYIGAKESAIFQICLFFVGLASLFIYWPLGLSFLAAWCIWIFADLFLIPGLIRKHSNQ